MLKKLKIIKKEKPKSPKSYYVILLLTPLILLLFLEVILRIFGFGDQYPLFIPSKSMSGYMQTNPDIINRYFSDPSLAPKIKPDTFYFHENKTKNSFRIIIQGGSTAAGFPFGRFASLQGMLHQRFKRLYPNKNIEIISTAMSAINSYSLLDFTDEIINIDPDLVLIYAGHNEYLGVMGVGSNYASKNSRATTLLYLKFKELRLFQLMQKIILFFQPALTSNNTQDLTVNDLNINHLNDNNRTLMASIAKDKTIVLNSKLYQQGITQFSENLKLILTKYQSKNIPVFMGTLISNEKDQAPFSSNKGDFSADAYFKKAVLLENNKLFKQARLAYVKAKDRDQLRFRAPSIFNHVIKDLLKQFKFELVDSETYIRQYEKNSIISFEHMYEHLHPNARGYFILSEAFVNKIISTKIIADKHEEYSMEKAWNDIPLTAVDYITANFKIKTLTSDYPFKKTKQMVYFGEANSFNKKIALEKLANHDWLKLHQKMLKHYQENNQYQDAAKVAGIIFDAFPNQHKTAWVAGQLYLALTDIKIALYYHKKAIELAPTNITYLLSAAHSYYINQQPLISINLLKQILKINPNHVIAKRQYLIIKEEQNDKI